MPERTAISIGGIVIGLIPDKATGVYTFQKRTQDFLSKKEAEINLRVHCGWFPDFNPDTIAFDTQVAWQLLQINEKTGILAQNPTMKILGVFPPDFLSGDIYVSRLTREPETYIFPFNHPLGEIFIMNLLGTTGAGMLLHATAVINEGNGYIFTGHGGAGKTTTARLWKNFSNAQILNDDKILIRKKDNKFYMYGTPWHGDGGLASPMRFPIKKIFILKKAKQNYIKPISESLAVSRLLVRGFLPLWDAEKIDLSLKFLEELNQEIDVSELGFLPDPSIIDFIQKLT